MGISRWRLMNARLKIRIRSWIGLDFRLLGEGLIVQEVILLIMTVLLNLLILILVGILRL